jgi:hypothetical protein
MQVIMGFDVNCVKTVQITRLVMIGICGFVFLKSCTQPIQSEQSDNVQPQITQHIVDTISARYTIQIIPSVNGTYGYQIADHGKVIIVQNSIPSLAGNHGFQTQRDAERCAELVISKLKRNEMPPSIKPSELDALGISYLKSNETN